MQNAAIYFYVLLLARGSGVGEGGGGGLYMGYRVPKLYPYYKNSSALIPSYTRRISFVIHYVCILPLNSQGVFDWEIWI